MLPSRSSSGPVRVSSYPRGTRRRAATEVARSRGTHHSLPRAAVICDHGCNRPNTVYNDSPFITLYIILAMSTGSQCYTTSEGEVSLHDSRCGVLPVYSGMNESARFHIYSKQQERATGICMSHQQQHHRLT